MVGLGDAVGAEGEEEPSQQASPPAARELLYEQVTAEGREDDGEEDEQVIGEDGIAGQMVDRGADQSRGEEMLGIGKDVPGGIDDIPLEEIGRVGEHGLSLPGDDPVVEHGIAVTPDDPIVDMQDEGPGEEDGHDQEEEEHHEVLTPFGAEDRLQSTHVHRFLGWHGGR